MYLFFYVTTPRYNALIGSNTVEFQVEYRTYRELVCGYYFGEVSEWLKVHAWKACVGENLPGVQIPPSPHQNNKNEIYIHIHIIISVFIFS